MIKSHVFLTSSQVWYIPVPSSAASFRLRMAQNGPRARGMAPTASIRPI